MCADEVITAGLAFVIVAVTGPAVLVNGVVSSKMNDADEPFLLKTKSLT